MLDNTITIAFDAEADGSPVNVVLTRDQEGADRSVYTFPDAEEGDHNLVMSRVRPKPSANFKGMARNRMKLSKPQSVLGVDGSTITSPATGELNLAFPKGMSEEGKIAFLQELIAVATNATIRTRFIVAQEV